MLISHRLMREINDVQVEMLRAVADVCKKLNIKFFMVHGSLLGTIRNHEFVPDDDDIDIAFFRKDYDIFVREAPKLLEEHYFMQTCFTDPEYPLGFGKVRDSRTAYVVEEAKHLKINHGIYIDVFPIDNRKIGRLSAKMFDLKYKLLNIRIASAFELKNQSFKKKIVRLLTKVMFPSCSAAIRKRERLITSSSETGYIRITGGKGAEQYMPKKWFSEAVENTFEGVDVFVPVNYDAYLSRIYGDYRNRTLVENKVSDNENIEVNACVVDTKTPYTQIDSVNMN